MSFFSKPEEKTISIYSYEVVDDETISTTADDTDPDASTTSGAHCAWCGDPPDDYGSHGICAFHAEQMLAQMATRRRSRGNA